MPVEDNPEVPFSEKILYALLGAAASAPLYHAISLLRQQTEKRIGDRRAMVGQSEMGPVITMLSLFMPEQKGKYFVGGFGVGMVLDDIIAKALPQMNIEPISVTETGEDAAEADYVRKFSKLIHIDPTLPLEEKEKQILPIFMKVIEEQKHNPLQNTAVRRLRNELGLKNDSISYMDTFYLQQWFLYHGEYESSEGLWEGHDRFRTLAKLFRIRDSGRVKKGGRPAFKFDCDDGAICTNQLLTSYGYSPYFMLISQKPPVEDGVHPLHHVFPVFRFKGELYALETIKQLPVVPITHVGSLFKNLKRAVLVDSNGIHEFEEWKQHMLTGGVRKTGRSNRWQPTKR